jgi:hypothetical protein
MPATPLLPKLQVKYTYAAEQTFPQMHKEDWQVANEALLNDAAMTVVVEPVPVYTLRWFEPATQQTGHVLVTELDPQAICCQGAEDVRRWYEKKNPHRIAWVVRDYKPAGKVIVL